jgi:hypothetical protein
MKANIKFDIKNINVSKYVTVFFSKNKKAISFMFFFCLALYCGYLWYIYIGNPNWSEEKKADYINSTKAREVVFNQDKFYSLVASIDERKRQYQENVSTANDAFGLRQ